MPAIEPLKKQQRINEQIRVSPVRVIGNDGTQMGILATEEAIKAARKVNLDLVEVAPNERPPVCRIMDYGKYKYQQKKRQHKSQSHQTKIKEIRVRPKTGEHDIEVKVNRARDFLEHKSKVIVTVVFRGRELAHVEEGRRVIDSVIAQLADVSRVEAAPVHHGRRMICTLAPNKRSVLPASAGAARSCREGRARRDPPFLARFYRLGSLVDLTLLRLLRQVRFSAVL